MDTKPTLFLLCGKIASGKTTFSAKIAKQKQCILISEDDWLAKLYPEEITSIPNYVKYSARLRYVVSQHVISLLKTDISVILDFPANTIENRSWLRDILNKSEALHELHYFDVDDEVCKARLAKRNSLKTHNFSPSADQFDIITSYFVPPMDKENFNVIIHH